MNIKGLAISLFLAAVTLLGCTIPGLMPQATAPPPQPGEPPLGELHITFTADTMSLQPGECATLQWSVEGGEAAQLDGDWVSQSGQRQVCPQTTTSYSLAVYVGAGPPSQPRAHEEVEIVVAAFATDRSTYTFAAPDEGEVKISVTLLFRRAFLELMDQKGWDVPDKIMEHQEVRIPLAGE
jgi:hypothetical protein